MGEAGDRFEGGCLCAQSDLLRRGNQRRGMVSLRELPET